MGTDLKKKKLVSDSEEIDYSFFYVKLQSCILIFKYIETYEIY
jgi:hypothetical protein